MYIHLGTFRQSAFRPVLLHYVAADLGKEIHINTLGLTCFPEGAWSPVIVCCGCCLTMHHALEIPEILLNIFGHCHPPTWQASDLLALAITCRAFREPALDVLWEELFDSSHLARCLPEATHQLDPSKEV